MICFRPLKFRLAGPMNPKLLNFKPSSSCATASPRLTPSTPATSSTARPCPPKIPWPSGLQILKKEKVFSRPHRLQMRTASNRRRPFLLDFLAKIRPRNYFRLKSFFWQKATYRLMRILFSKSGKMPHIISSMSLPRLIETIALT